MIRLHSKTGALLSTLIVSACLALGPSVAVPEGQGGGHGMHGGAMHGEGKGMHGGGKCQHGQGKGMHGGGMHGMGKGMHGGGMHGMDKGMHGGGMHGMDKGMHGGHGKQKGQHLYGVHWEQTLTDEQQARLDALHAAYAKTKAPRKARMKAIKVELTVLATASQPDKEAINARIDELLAVKAETMRAKYGYIAAQRQVLTPEQQVSFDMETIHKAMHGKKGHH